MAVVGVAPGEGHPEVRVAVASVAVVVLVGPNHRSQAPDRHRDPEQTEDDADPDGPHGVEDRRERRLPEREPGQPEPRDHQGDVAETETRARQRREPGVAVLAGQGRDTGDVVGFDGVGHAEQPRGGYRGDDGGSHYPQVGGDRPEAFRSAGPTEVG
ncbi:hypothetical protein ACFQER_06045 [Halomicroarcula sp. GCM10025894]|uniref:hypothetical protein n=1 Tax=Halomicroarcula sp. GCM10025894 TaxID=3252673 RepID=UPI0036240A36